MTIARKLLVDENERRKGQASNIDTDLPTRYILRPDPPGH